MTVTSAAERRAAAQLRRQGAESARHERGDIAYRQYRSAAPGIGTARQVPCKTTVKAVTEMRNGKELVHTFGFFTRYNMPYPMWDQFGEYDEQTKPGSGAESLASNPDVSWLVNHKGVTMARTTNGTLELAEKPEGGWHDGWLNPQRQDVKDIVIAIQDYSVDQMSYAFMIPEGGGWWNDDFTAFDIVKWDIHRGDVSAVNYGANPFTDITARTAEVLQDLEHLPAGALHEAGARLARRGVPIRERVEVRSTGTRETRGPRPAPGAYPERLANRLERTANRIAEATPGGARLVEQVRSNPLQWYEIRNADGRAETDEPAGVEDDTATVFVFDEIGGSMGVDAKKFAADLEATTAPNIKLRVNSPGGAVFDGIAIHSALLHHPARVTAYVDGLAASAASFLVMAADEIVMMPGAQMMIHDASATVEGNRDDMIRWSDFLDRQSENVADLYIRVGGGTRDEWRELMLAETWMFAEEAVEMGLADRVAEIERRGPADAEERMARSFDLSKFGYRFQSRSAAPAPRRQTRAGNYGPGQPRVRPIDDRIEASSLGTPDAVAMRERTSPEVAEQIVERSKTISATQDQPKGRSIALIEAQLALDE
jgi:HK97 family phage prohead protease